MADALVSGASDLQKSCGFNSHLLHQTKIIRTILVRIIFVCVLLFYFFVLLFSFGRIVFEIKNKKEERKVAVNFIIGS